MTLLTMCKINANLIIFRDKEQELSGKKKCRRENTSEKCPPRKLIYLENSPQDITSTRFTFESKPYVNSPLYGNFENFVSGPNIEKSFKFTTLFMRDVSFFFFT